MYEVTVFIYDYITSRTFKKGRALIFQPFPGMVYREAHTTADGDSHVWIADMVTVVADFQDIAGATSQGYVVLLSMMESETLLPHEFSEWLANTGWVVTEPPKGIRLDSMPDIEDDDDEVDTLPSEPG